MKKFYFFKFCLNTVFLTFFFAFIFSNNLWSADGNSQKASKKVFRYQKEKNNSDQNLTCDNLRKPAIVEPRVMSSQKLFSSGNLDSSGGGLLPEGVLIYPEGPHYNSEGPDRDFSLEWDESIPLNTHGTVQIDESIKKSKENLRNLLNEMLKNAPASDTEQNGLDPSAPEIKLVPGSGLRGAPEAGGIGFKSYPNVATLNGPPDVDLNVGNSYVVAAYNSYIHVYNKAGSSLGTLSLASLFTGLTNCSNGSACDPQIIYDDELDRYVVTALAVVGSNDSRLCVAVSKAETPITAANNWWTYEIDPAGTGIADYPHTAVGQDAIFIGAVWFPSGGGNQAVGWVIDRTKTYAGNPLGTGDVAQYTFSNAIMPQPAERRGFDLGQYPPTNTPHYIICPNLNTGAHDLWRWPVPSLMSTPTLWQASVTAYPGAINQPNNTAYTANPIDALDIRMTDVELRWPYLWTCRTGSNASNFDTIQWNQINVNAGTPSVVQTNEYTLTDSHLWMADCTSDYNQNFVIGFNRASATGPLYVGAYLAGRQVADTPNTLSGPLTVKAGEKRYENGLLQSGYYRWGDYNGVSIDPNGCDIWVNIEYVRNRATSPPSTGVEDTSWIANYRFADCSVTPSAYLNKVDYFCVDDVSATIIDTTGTPSNAVYHTQNGSVSATISGSGPVYNVSPTTITALNGVHGNNVWLTITGGNVNNYSSANSTIDCQRQVCVYQIDPLSGGCDGDLYHDEGEVLNYNIAIANYEPVDLPGPFQATLTSTDPDITIINPTVTFPALPSMTYSYGYYPFGVRYNGSRPANCVKTLNFNITNIQAVDGAWTNTGGGCAASQAFSEIGNADFQVTTTLINESFDGTTFPPTGWARLDVDTSGGNLNWARATGTVHPAGYPTHSGAGLAYANTWTVYPPSSERLYRSTPSDLSSYAGAQLSYWMFHDNQYINQDYVQLQVCEAGTTTCATNGTHWVDVGQPIYRYNGSANIWEQHTFDLTAYAGAGHTSVQIGLLAVNDYGNDIHIDDVVLSAGNLACEADLCSPAPNLVYGNYSELDDVACNNNTYVEPGEVGDLYIYLDNQGNDWAYDTTATLSCPTCDAVFGPGMIDICDAQADYSNIPYGTSYVYASTSSNPFKVAIDPTVPCPATGSQIPFQVTVQATNPYGPVVIDTPVNIGYEDSIHPDPEYGMSFYDRFELAPGTAGSAGRWGFTNAWTATGTWSQANDVDGCWADPDVSQARNSGRNTTSDIRHIFSTAGATTNIGIWWEWDVGYLAAQDTWYLDWTYNGGTNWCTVVSDPGTNAGAYDWNCWSGSLYYTVYDCSPPTSCCGPDAAASMLNNPNFGIRIRLQHSAQNRTGRLGALWLAATGWQCASTTCTGNCQTAPPPPTPNNNDVPGTPFRLTKGTNAGTVHATWGTTCGSPDNFNIYWGDLSTIKTTKTVTNANCAIGTSGDVDNLLSPSPAAGQGYWAVITAVKGSAFGRHGNDSTGTERSLTGDAAACGGTKDITQSTCAAFFAQEEKPYRSQKYQFKYEELMKKPLSRCGDKGCGNATYRKPPEKNEMD